MSDPRSNSTDPSGSSGPASDRDVSGASDGSGGGGWPPRRARTLGVGLLLLAGVALALNINWVAKNIRSLRALGPGSRAPQFELVTLEGDRVRSEDLRGRVLLIDFWSITCPPCLESLPHLNGIVRRFADQPVTVLAIHTQGGPRWEGAVAAEAASMGLRFPVLLDPGSRVSDAFRVRVMPTTVLVDGRGRIRKVWRGVGDISRYEAEIRRVLRDR